MNGVRARAGSAALLIAALVALTGCSAPVDAPRPASASASARLCTPTRARALACGLYVASTATRDGKTQAWLRRMPIRLWFLPLNGVRTAIVDAPVNTSNVPTLSTGSTLWTGHDTFVTAVGCTRGCEADGFVAALTSSTAAYRVDPDDGAITIATAQERVRFEPTAAPARPGSCDTDSPDPLPCTRVVSVQATDAGAVVEALRLRPITVEFTGARGHHTATVRAPEGTTWRLPLRPEAARGGFTTGGRASRAAPGAEGDFLAAFFRTTVRWSPHFGSLLLTNGTRTLQLEPVN